mgnify:CR=1 FL=1
MAKIQTFELDRWSEPDENHRVKHIGMADAKETFDKLKTHLEAHGPVSYTHLTLPTN